MPRCRREERYQAMQCIQCEAIFDAVRDDAKTCSARCRVAFNRDKKAAAKLRARRNFTLSIMMRCGVCLTNYDVIATPLCPVCKTWTPAVPAYHVEGGKLVEAAANCSTSSPATT